MFKSSESYRAIITKRITSRSRQSDTRREFSKAFLLRCEIFGVLKLVGVSVSDAYPQTLSNKSNAWQLDQFADSS